MQSIHVHDQFFFLIRFRTSIPPQGESLPILTLTELLSRSIAPRRVIPPVDNI